MDFLALKKMLYLPYNIYHRFQQFMYEKGEGATLVPRELARGPSFTVVPTRCSPKGKYTTTIEEAWFQLPPRK